MPQTAGQWLKQQREQQQRSQKDIAHECRLSIEMIQKIESDDIEDLRQTPYLKGYIRAMAKALDVSPEVPLQALAPVEPVPEPIAMAAPVAQESPLTDKPHWPRAASVIGLPLSRRARVLGAGALLGVGLLSAWWAMRPNTEALPVMAITETAMASEMFTEDEEPSAAQSATLILDFSVQTWASVFDANQDKLMTGLMPVGEAMTLTGKPPFEILLGDADAVSIRYDDQWVDLSDFEQQKMVQFSLNRAKVADAQW